MTAERLQPQLATGPHPRCPRASGTSSCSLALSELSHEEMSQALGISYGTVGSRLSRARKKLQSMIDQEEVNG